MSEKAKGRVLQVMGPVVDVSFEEGGLTIYRGVKADLNDSAIYRKVKLLKGE